jgi:transcriptional regulator with XRE-family HTH domain
VLLFIHNEERRNHIMNNQNTESMGQRIERTRQERRLSAAELARKLGVTSTAVWNWEKNGRHPRHAVLSDLSKTLGVSIEWLRSGSVERVNGGQLIETAARENGNGNGKVQTVAQIIETARNQIAMLTGVPFERVKIHVEFVAE